MTGKKQHNPAECRGLREWSAFAHWRTMNSSTRGILLAAAIAGFLGVSLGAFGAHGLRSTLQNHGTTEIWRTAVLYHLIHAAALLGLASWRDGEGHPLRNAPQAAACWVAGVVLFSGSLYGLALGGPRLLGPITPVGGAFFLAGWLLVALAACRRSS